MNRRMERVNAVLRQEISRVLASELKDPRLSSMVSITRVDTSPDLHLAKVYVSVLGNQGEKRVALRVLRSASGFVRRRMRDRVAMRVVPAVRFYIDESIEQGAAILKIIDEVYPGPESDQGS